MFQKLMQSAVLKGLLGSLKSVATPVNLVSANAIADSLKIAVTYGCPLPFSTG